MASTRDGEAGVDEIRSRAVVVSPVMPFIIWLFAQLVPAPNVAIQTFRFRPDTLVVAPGATITWTNHDDVEHTVVPDSGAGVQFRGVLQGKGTTYRISITKQGTFAYHCDRHTFMRGVVRVTSSGAKP